MFVILGAIFSPHLTKLTFAKKYFNVISSCQNLEPLNEVKLKELIIKTSIEKIAMSEFAREKFKEIFSLTHELMLQVH